MKTLLMVTALTLASAVSVWTQTIDLPRPWLTLDRSTKVLHLQCKPPQEAHLDWRSVHNLELSAFLPQNRSTNISLVKITSTQKVPKVNDLFMIHNVAFQGDWYDNFVSVDFLFPVTDKELGRYFCSMHYSDQADTLLKFTTETVVDQDFVSSHTYTQPKNINGFFVKVIDTHEVRVTWRKPESSKFTEASVSRMFVGEGGKPTAPSMSLFTTNGIRHLEYNSDVILTHFTSGHNGNLSMTLYVETDAHSLSYRYTCRVPYPACTGHNDVSCTCCQRAANPNTPVCSTPPEDSQTCSYLFYVCVILIPIVTVVLTVVLILYGVFKIGRCPDKKCFQNIFTAKHKSSLGGSIEEQPIGRQGINPSPDLSTQATDSPHSNSNRTRGEEQPSTVSRPTDFSIPVQSENNGSDWIGQPERVHLPPKSTSAENGHEDLQDSLGAFGVSPTEVQSGSETDPPSVDYVPLLNDQGNPATYCDRSVREKKSQ